MKREIDLAEYLFTRLAQLGSQLEAGDGDDSAEMTAGSGRVSKSSSHIPSTTWKTPSPS